MLFGFINVPLVGLPLVMLCALSVRGYGILARNSRRLTARKFAGVFFFVELTPGRQAAGKRNQSRGVIHVWLSDDVVLVARFSGTAGDTKELPASTASTAESRSVPMELLST